MKISLLMGKGFIKEDTHTGSEGRANSGRRLSHCFQVGLWLWQDNCQRWRRPWIWIKCQDSSSLQAQNLGPTYKIYPSFCQRELAHIEKNGFPHFPFMKTHISPWHMVDFKFFSQSPIIIAVVIFSYSNYLEKQLENMSKDLGIIIHTWNPSTWKDKAGRL